MTSTKGRHGSNYIGVLQVGITIDNAGVGRRMSSCYSLPKGANVVRIFFTEDILIKLVRDT